MSLTRGGVALLAIIVFVVSVTTASNATAFIVVAALLALLVLNLPYALFAVRGLTVRREHPSHIKEGSAVVVRLLVTNQSRRGRILLRFFDRGPIEGVTEPVQVPALARGQTVPISYTGEVGRRGVYTFSSCRVESSSPFGLVNARRELPVSSELVVYPLYYELTGAAFPFHKTYSGMTGAPAARPGEGPSFFGLREYRQGDPIRKIHWPTTVRARTVMVKEFEEDMHSSVTLVLDSCRRSATSDAGDTNMEVAVRAAASMANYMLVNGHPTTLTWYDTAAGCVRSDRATGDLTPVLDALARLTVGPMAAADLVHTAATRSTGQANWIVLLLAADQAVMSELLRLRSQGTELVVILIEGNAARGRADDEAWRPSMLELFDDAGIGTIVVEPGTDLQACLSRHLRPPRRMRI